MALTVVTTYLQMLSPEALRPAAVPAVDGVEMRRAEVPCPALSRFLYTAVGGDWYWRDRLPWSAARWRAHLERPQVQTWLLWLRGTPAGYVELEQHAAGDVEIAYFGLLPEFIGRGLGGHLLSAGIVQAWAMNAQRVWVHTCTLDGPQALANYQARGMSIYRQESKQIADPGAPDGAWPGADAEV